MHGDPRELYPWYEGALKPAPPASGNPNLPLGPEPQTTASLRRSIRDCRRQARCDRADLASFDAHVGDLTANLAVTAEGCGDGARIGALGLPTPRAGRGYIEKLADNLTAFLSGFLQLASRSGLLQSDDSSRWRSPRVRPLIMRERQRIVREEQPG